MARWSPAMEQHRLGREIAAKRCARRGPFCRRDRPRWPTRRTAARFWRWASISRERMSHSSMFSPMVLPVTVLHFRFESAEALQFAKNGVDAAGAHARPARDNSTTAKPCTGTARAAKWRRCAQCRRGCRPRGRWPACAEPYSWNRPWRRRARGVVERLERGDVARFQVQFDKFHNHFRRAAIQGFALFRDGEDGAVAGQGHAEGFAKAVHRVGGEHAGA